jgi:hypothetical protein
MSASRAGAIWKDESPSGSCRQPMTRSAEACAVASGDRKRGGSPPSFLLPCCWQRSHASRAGAQLARPCQVGLPNSLLTVATGGRTITLRESSLDAKLRDSTTLSCRYHYKGGIFSVRVSRYRTPALAARQFRSLCKTARPAAIGSHSCLQDLRFTVNSGFRYRHLRDAVALHGARVVAVGTSSNPPPASLGFHVRAVKYLLAQP